MEESSHSEIPDPQDYNFPNRKAYLDRLFARDPERHWPPPTVFVPVWTGAGKLHAVIKVAEQDIPEYLINGEVPKGEVVEPFEVNRGVFHPLEKSFLAQQLKMAKYEGQQRRREARRGRSK